LEVVANRRDVAMWRLAQASGVTSPQTETSVNTSWVFRAAREIPYWIKGASGGSIPAILASWQDRNSARAWQSRCAMIESGSKIDTTFRFPTSRPSLSAFTV
jgi:hypothetical protein